MIKDKAKSVVRKKTSGSVKQQKRSGSISTELSQNCRCICSSVCSIEGPDSITAGTEKTYTLGSSYRPQPWLCARHRGLRAQQYKMDKGRPARHSSDTYR